MGSDIDLEISVVICTRNRAAQLRQALESLAVQSTPPGLAWEVVIVDNGSTDDTPAVIASFADRLPIRRAEETTPGLSNARNRGVAEVRGAYMLWTDDDVLLAPGWIEAYVRAIRSNPKAAVFAGKVTPVFEGAPPAWWAAALPHLTGLTAHRDLGPEPCALSIEGDRMPFGANFAVRTVEQRRHLYDPLLGVGPGRRRLGEETQVVRGVLQDGGEGVWVPDAEVLHQIPAARMTVDYAGVYFRSIGETWAYLDAAGGENFMGPALSPAARRFRGAPLWVWREWARFAVQYAIAKAFAGPDVWMQRLRMKGFYAGALDFWTRRETT